MRRMVGWDGLAAFCYTRLSVGTDQITLAGANSGGRPGAGWARRVSGPRARARASQRLTVSSDTPKAAAVARWDQPCCFKCNVRKLPNPPKRIPRFLTSHAGYRPWGSPTGKADTLL